LMKASRSHQIDSPSVAAELSTGRMNACNLCHMDQTLAWTAEKLSAWYGIASPPVAEPEEREVADGMRNALHGNAAQRAIAAWNMRRDEVREASGSDWMIPVLARLLLDPYPAVRHAAAGSIRAIPGYELRDFDYLAPEEVRRGAEQALLAQWRSAGRRPPADAAARLLQDGRGALDEARFEALLGQRDDRRVFRGE